MMASAMPTPNWGRIAPAWQRSYKVIDIGQTRRPAAVLQWHPVKSQQDDRMAELKSYVVWDAPTRWFHWINALCVVGLTAIGLVILNASGLGVSNAGKVTLKTVHTWIGYVFALNLLWRIVWAFLGNRFARWREILPGGPGYLHALRSYVASFLAGHPEQYLGHNPLARLSVGALFVLILIQAVTGLVLASTDLFYPAIRQLDRAVGCRTRRGPGHAGALLAGSLRQGGVGQHAGFSQAVRRSALVLFLRARCPGCAARRRCHRHRSERGRQHCFSHVHRAEDHLGRSRRQDAAWWDLMSVDCARPRAAGARQLRHRGCVAGCVTSTR